MQKKKTVSGVRRGQKKLFQDVPTPTMPLFPIVTASATSKKSPLILKTKAFNTGILECFRQEATAGASDKSMVS